MDAAAATAAHGWRYPAPYDIYDLAGEDLAGVLAFLTDPANHYFRIDNQDGEMLALCCFGHDAQVPGGDYREPALDIGMGVRPDLTGRRMGAMFAGATIAFGRQTYAPERLRVTIAAFNLRAQRVWMKHGFGITQSFLAPSGRAYLVLVGQA